MIITAFEVYLFISLFTTQLGLISMSEFSVRNIKLLVVVVERNQEHI